MAGYLKPIAYFDDASEGFAYQRADLFPEPESQHSYGSSFYTGFSPPIGPFTQDPNALSNDRSGSFSAYVPASCGYGSSSTEGRGFASGDVPLEYHTYNDASSPIFHPQPSAPKLIPHRCSSLTLDDMEGWVGGMTSTDQTSEQADDGADSCFEGSKDLDNEEDDYDVDNGEFVIHDVKGVQHVERPGRLREDNGYLEWQNPKTKGWRRAVIHHNIRAELISRAQALYPSGRYDHPQEAGSGPHDVTSFHIDYQSWGPKRENRPSILYEFDPPEKPAQRVRPGFMMHDGMVVLNHQNNPVLDWDIPTTLSSITPGALMEAWRRKFGLEQEDVRARMVRYHFRAVNGRTIREALPHKNATINMPMQRFRDKAGCIAWIQRQGKLRAGTLKLMRSEGVDPETNGNSTKPFGRDLGTEEQKEVKKGDQANFPPKTLAAVTGPSKTGKSQKRSHEEADGSDDEVDSEDSPGSKAHADPPCHTAFPGMKYRKRVHMTIGEDAENMNAQHIGSHAAAMQRQEGYNRVLTTNFAQQVQASMRAQKKAKGMQHRRRIDGQIKSTRVHGEHRKYKEPVPEEEPSGSREMSVPSEETDSEMGNFKGEETDVGSSSNDMKWDDNELPPSSQRPNNAHGVLSDHEEDQELEAPVSVDLGSQPVTADEDSPTPEEEKEGCFGGLLVYDDDLENHRRKVRAYLGEGQSNYNGNWESFAKRPRMLGDPEDDLDGDDGQHEANRENENPEGAGEVLRGETYSQKPHEGFRCLTESAAAGKDRSSGTDKRSDLHFSQSPYPLPDVSVPSDPQGQARQRRPAYQKPLMVKTTKAPRSKAETEPQATTLEEKTAQNNDTASAAGINCRNVVPQTQSERQSIMDALQATREAFFEYVGEPAPQTDQTQSYLRQWTRLRASFEYDWSDRPNGRAPYLIQLPKWYTSLEDWPPHKKDAKYYKAWRRSHRMPIVRLPNGEAINLPGEFLERIARYPSVERSFLLDERYRAMGFIAVREEEQDEGW